MPHRFLPRSLLALLFLLLGSLAQAATVTLAGFAYSGDSKSMAARFPYSQKFEKAQAAAGRPLNKQIAQALQGKKPANFELNQSSLTELKGRDQAIVVALVVTGETVSAERFGNVAKLLTQVRAQAMFFDFKTMTVLRAYPFSFTHLDVIDHYPSPAEMHERFKAVYLGDQGKAGIIERFTDIVAKATVPEHVPRFIQVNQVQIGDEARQVLTPQLKSAPGVAETWAADLFAESLSSKTGVPLLPYSKGYAIGNVMSMRVADGDVFMLKLPEADYTISLDIPRFKKIKSGESAAGTSLIYGVYTHVKIQEPVSARAYLDTDLKNGEVKLIPASQDSVDDFPAYYDAIKGLFVKLSDNLAGNQSDWLKTSSASSDIGQQVTSTRELLKSCK
ncbi:hypothetical protein OL229_20920 [Neisseriaceae bacterium JH1-16]|nr:hypothetical protein [Neisseriaceae bacterium JH1-16]